MDAAFCRAERVTLTGSMMPAAIRSTYSPVGVEAVVAGQVGTFGRATTPLEAGVLGDLRSGWPGTADDVRAGSLVARRVP
jgi:hypothetical protein